MESSRLIHMNDIASRIKAIREHLDLTQAALGKYAGGLSKSAVNQWESGVSKPAWEALSALRKNLGISPDWIMEGVGSMFLGQVGANTPTLSHPGPDGLPYDGIGLTPQQRALLGNFNRMTSEQKEAFLRESEEIKRNNEKIIEELTRQKTGNGNNSH